MGSRTFGPIELLLTTSQLRCSKYAWSNLRDIEIRRLVDELREQMRVWADAEWAKANDRV